MTIHTKHVFTDIDGTMYDHGYVPPSTVSALRAAKANGHKIYICTGRPVGAIPAEIADIIDYNGLICSSGSYIELDKQIFLDYFFPEDLVIAMVALFRRYPVLFTLETNYAVFYSDPAVNANEGLGLPIYEFSEQLLHDQSFHKAFIYHHGQFWPETNKICVYSADDPQLLHKVSDQLPHDNVLATAVMRLKSGWYLEVLPRNISKSSALNYLVTNHKIPYGSTIAIGDSMNDYEVVKYAEIGVAMGNGDDRLKEVADLITTDLHNDGYAKAFKELELI